MKTIKETDLTDFEFWAGAKYFADYLTRLEKQQISNAIEELYEDGLTETEINDLFWFDTDFICSLIGLTEEEILNR